MAPNATQPDGPERSPMHGNSGPRLEQSQGGGRRRRVEVASAKGRAPPADREDREIEVPGEVCHPGEEVGITREVDAVGPIEHVADRRRRRTERHPPSVVGSGNGPDANAPDRQLVARVDLMHVLEARRTDEAPGIAGHHEGRRAVQLPKAPDVEVILVGVRHEHGVDRGDLEIRRFAAAPHGTDAAHEERVEQELHVVELEPDRGMSEPAQTGHGPSARRNTVTNSSPWASVYESKSRRRPSPRGIRKRDSAAPISARMSSMMPTWSVD